MNNYYTNPNRAKVVFLAKHDYTVSEIERIAPCPNSTICRILKEHNIVAITRGQKTCKLIKPLRKKGMSASEIANVLGMKRDRVKTALRTMGMSNAITTTMTCPVCGKTFETNVKQQMYCSQSCMDDVRHRIRDKRLNDANIGDVGISLKRVCEIDRGVCYICNTPVNWEDYTLKNGKKVVHSMYPSIDHVIPLSKGGTHSWDNVRLAHKGCNCKKCDKLIS